MSSIADQTETLNEATTFLDLGRAYHAQADLLLEALIARAPIKSAEAGLPVRHLYSHAIELYLKSFLRGAGVARKDLRQKFRHKLGKLYVAAKALGLSIKIAESAHFEMVVDRLKNGHEDYEFRYFEGSISTVDPVWIQTATHSLSNSVGEVIEHLKSELESEALQKGQQFLSLPSKVVLSVGGKIPPTGCP